MLPDLPAFQAIQKIDTLFVKQNEDALRIITGWQTLNHYAIMNEAGETLAVLAERDEGFFATVKRLVFRNRRPLKIDICDPQGQQLAVLVRPWFWFFSDLYVYNASGSGLVGVVRRRFSFFWPKYDLCEGPFRVFAHLRCPLLGGLTLGGSIMGNRNYNVVDSNLRETGTSILRVWNGLMRIFTDEDTYCVQFAGPSWSIAQRLIILSAAISIDFDSFEGDSSAIREGEGVANTVGSMIGSIDSNG